MDRRVPLDNKLLFFSWRPVQGRAGSREKKVEQLECVREKRERASPGKTKEASSCQFCRVTLDTFDSSELRARTTRRTRIGVMCQHWHEPVHEERSFFLRIPRFVMVVTNKRCRLGIIIGIGKIGPLLILMFSFSSHLFVLVSMDHLAVKTINNLR